VAGLQSFYHWTTVNARFEQSLKFSPMQHSKDSIISYHKVELSGTRGSIQRITKEWRWELFTWSLGTAAIFTIMILLSGFRNQPTEQWKSRVQMNAMIAALAQTAQTALLVPIASSIGQLKWIWFQQKPRSTIDLERYDQASRGPEGSIKLLFRYPKPYVTHVNSIGLG